MKEILFSVALMISTNTGYAQETEPRRTTFLSVNFCSDYDTIVNDLVNNYNERLLFLGNGVTTWEDNKGNSEDALFRTLMFVNQSTRTWSLVQVYKDGTTCYMTGGDEFEPYTD